MTRKKKLSRREELRRDREARRPEIEGQWVLRCNKRDLEEGLSKWNANGWWRDDKDTAVSLLVAYLPYVKYAAMAETLESSEVSRSDLCWILARSLRVIELAHMPYHDYLQTSEWKGRSERAKERWGYQCALNEKHQAADAHHRTYLRRGLEQKDDLIPLCRECHSSIHGRAV